ncbi:MAG: SDR family oxidoreductase [Chloroflexi bacterium]|nr:SDR family oxidoreductase [Chloroflexota bacterium]MDA1240577.1 SDR family oxidoreductase [Chloroflexota bacterium]
MAEVSNLPLAGRVAIVTGAAGRGIGRATALVLARDGADVLINTHRSADAAGEVADAVRSLGRRAEVVTGDSSDPAVVATMFATARERLGEPGIVVVSTGARWVPRRIDAIPPEEWREAMAEEIDALYLAAREALPAMRAAQWGRIVAVGGFDADQWPRPSTEAPFDYGLGKAARHWMVRTLARQEAAHGVTVNAVAPGPVTRIPLDALMEAVLQRSRPDGLRQPTQVDVAEAIGWLCRSDAVTGTVMGLPGPEPGAVSAP